MTGDHRLFYNMKLNMILLNNDLITTKGPTSDNQKSRSFYWISFELAAIATRFEEYFEDPYVSSMFNFQISKFKIQNSNFKFQNSKFKIQKKTF